MKHTFKKVLFSLTRFKKKGGKPFFYFLFGIFWVKTYNRKEQPKMANALIFASYGGADVTQMVRIRLQQQGSLNFGPNQYHTWMGDPFPNQYKDFVVVSLDNSCIPNRFRVNLFECQITPGPGPSSVRREPPHAHEIVLANYGGRDCTAQVLQMFAQCGPAGLTFQQPPHMIFGDPLPGIVKAFVIVYTNMKGPTTPPSGSTARRYRSPTATSTHTPAEALVLTTFSILTF